MSGFRVAGSKYGNMPAILDGVRFDSTAEAHRYQQLRLLEQAGEITKLRRQPGYVLQEGFRASNGQWQRAITYYGDFEYIEDGQIVCEDVKGTHKGRGTMTPEWRIKAKLFRKRYPHIDLRVVGG